MGDRSHGYRKVNPFPDTCINIEQLILVILNIIDKFDDAILKDRKKFGNSEHAYSYYMVTNVRQIQYLKKSEGLTFRLSHSILNKRI
jgi:hypothetical protein